MSEPRGRPPASDPPVEETAPRVRRGAVTVAVILAISLLSGGVGTFPPESRRFWGVLGVAAALLVASGGCGLGARVLTGLLTISILVFQVSDPGAWLLLLTVALCLTAGTVSDSDRKLRSLE